MTDAALLCPCCSNKPCLSVAARSARRLLHPHASPKGKECQVREQIRKLIHDAQRRATIAADCLEHNGPQLGDQAIRLAQVAAALHMSQAAPLLGQLNAPAILPRHETPA